MLYIELGGPCAMHLTEKKKCVVLDQYSYSCVNVT